MRVYIADDSRPVAEMLTELLAAPGRTEVVGVGETEDAVIAAVARLVPDVVVLDLQLGAGSGTNVIRAVRADPKLAKVLLLVTSNHTAPQLRAGCLELGADGFFDKVKELGQLGAKVAALAEARRRGGP